MSRVCYGKFSFVYEPDFIKSLTSAFTFDGNGESYRLFVVREFVMVKVFYEDSVR